MVVTKQHILEGRPVAYLLLDRAEIEQGTTKKRCLLRLIFLDQFVTRNKNFLGKKPKSWTHPLKTGV